MMLTYFPLKAMKDRNGINQRKTKQKHQRSTEPRKPANKKIPGPHWILKDKPLCWRMAVTMSFLQPPLPLDIF